MPIKINGDAASVAKASKHIYSAKFFSKDITGTGKTIGLLNQSIFPANLAPNIPENIDASRYWYIKTVTTTTCKTTTYPLSPFGPYCAIGIKGAIAFNNDWFKLSSGTIGDDYLALIPETVRISEPLTVSDDPTIAAQIGKKCAVGYRLLQLSVDTSTPDNLTTIVGAYYTENPLLTFDALLPSFTGCSTADRNAFFNYLTAYNLHTEICKLSEIWQTTLIDEIIKAYDCDKTLFPIENIVRYISQYKVMLPQYKTLYAELKKRFDADTLKRFTKMNTYLLLQETLDGLSQTQFAALPAPGTTNKQLDLSWCSKEQFDAITSAAPLNQVQAGAGTGKSTVIKARLDYLDYLGIDMNKVMVLSFTNAAADNIKAKCPGVQSMTIAKMIDSIYVQNHPTHQLSSSLARRGEGSTFTNSLELYRDTSPLVPALISAVNGVEKNNDYATLLRLVEENHDEIISILDTIRQTTFQLEIIICYLEHATMTIPFDIEYLLIDEVQDNAIFEFVFFLNLTSKLHNHLYLVGDCSQTLYEFRASDPRALNAIEASKLFASFPLNINYRSNQNILSFANALLDDIEANQYANIQLQAFNLNTITKQSFSEAVTVNYTRLNRISQMQDWICKKLRDPCFLDWVNDKLAKHEQICVLTYKRREAAMLQRELEKLFPNNRFVSIIPAKNTNVSYFSRYVSANRQALLTLPVTSVKDMCDRIRAEIIANLSAFHLTPQSSNYQIALTILNTMLREWQTENTNVLQDALTQFNSNAINRQRLAEIVGETLIDYEIKRNALRQSLLSQKNAAKKENTDSADFVFSTIHSAKGLEFDNVVLLYQNKNQMEEDTKRMYYVALTRAKKSEYILAYDTVLNALVQTRHESILSHLPDAVGTQLGSTA